MAENNNESDKDQKSPLLDMAERHHDLLDRADKLDDDSEEQHRLIDEANGLESQIVSGLAEDILKNKGKFNELYTPVGGVILNMGYEESRLSVAIKVACKVAELQNITEAT